jgi:hypothetical protein
MGVILLAIVFFVLIVVIGFAAYRMMKGEDIYGRKK